MNFQRLRNVLSSAQTSSNENAKVHINGNRILEHAGISRNQRQTHAHHISTLPLALAPSRIGTTAAGPLTLISPVRFLAGQTRKYLFPVELDDLPLSVSSCFMFRRVSA